MNTYESGSAILVLHNVKTKKYLLKAASDTGTTQGKKYLLKAAILVLHKVKSRYLLKGEANLP